MHKTKRAGREEARRVRFDRYRNGRDSGIIERTQTSPGTGSTNRTETEGSREVFNSVVGQVSGVRARGGGHDRRIHFVRERDGHTLRPTIKRNTRKEKDGQLGETSRGRSSEGHTRGRKGSGPKMRSPASSAFHGSAFSRGVVVCVCVCASEEDGRERAMAANQPSSSRAKTTCHPDGACLPGR